MLELRPHHFLCTVGFEGKGYSDEFVRGYHEIASRLRAPDGDEQLIRVAAATDSVCAPCPNRRGTACATEDKIRTLDRGHASVLGLEPGETLTWGEAKKRIAARMTDGQFERVCGPCSWRPLGMCKNALQKLRATSALALFAVAALAPSSHAARAAVANPTGAVGTQQERPLELARAGIFKKHKSKPARSLKRAYDALEAKHFSQAASLAAPVAGSSTFGDYGNWIVANARYGSARAAIDAKNYSQAFNDAGSAVAAFLKIEARFPYSPMLKNLQRDVGLAEALQGEARAGQKKWAAADASFEQGFQRLMSSNSMGLVRPETLTRFAQACKAVKTQMCNAWVLRFSFYYPHGSEELKAITQVLPDAAEHPRPAFVGKLTQTYKSPDLDQTAFDQNIGLYLDGKFGAAIKGLQRFIDEYPKSPYRYRARYWFAQAMTHEQQHEKAQQAYENLQHDSPLTYYGLLAAFASGRNMDAPLDLSVIPLVTERDPLLHASELLHLQRAENFVAEHAHDLAAMELRELRVRDALSSPFLMYVAALASESHAYTTAFNVMGELIQRGYEGAASSQFLSMIFPLAHMEDIKKQAALNDLDPLLVLSLIKQESAFDHNAISGSGALGLMQLMPATASDTDPTVERADLVDPTVNIRVGTKYLKQLLTRFNGNVVLALAGYNAGPAAADRWFKEQGGKRGMVDFIETIPYKETREYVSSIIRNYFWYSRKLAPGGPAKPLNYFWNMYGPLGVPAIVPAPSQDSKPQAVAPVPAASSQPLPAVPTAPIEE